MGVSGRFGNWRRLHRYALAAAALALLVSLLGTGLSFWMTQSSSAPSPSAAALEDDFDAIFDTAVARMRAGRYREALKLWHRALRNAPEVPEVAVNMGFTLLELGELVAARDLFVGAIELDAYQANAYYGLAVASEALGDLPGATGAMRSYLHLSSDPDDEAYRRRARAALWEWEAAIASRAGERPGRVDAYRSGQVPTR